MLSQEYLGMQGRARCTPFIPWYCFFKAWTQVRYARILRQPWQSRPPAFCRKTRLNCHEHARNTVPHSFCLYKAIPQVASLCCRSRSHEWHWCIRCGVLLHCQRHGLTSSVDWGIASYLPGPTWQYGLSKARNLDKDDFSADIDSRVINSIEHINLAQTGGIKEHKHSGHPVFQWVILLLLTWTTHLFCHIHKQPIVAQQTSALQ